MKKLIVAILLIAAGYSFLKSSQRAYENRPPHVISNPVYSDTRVSMTIPDGGSIDMVVLMKNIDQADCEEQTRRLESELRRGEFASCATCTQPTSKCLTELPPRFLAMFENRPSSVTYLSLAAGNSAERDLRVVYWGVTVEQSNSICSAVPEFQKELKGVVSCVRARSG